MQMMMDISMRAGKLDETMHMTALIRRMDGEEALVRRADSVWMESFRFIPYSLDGASLRIDEFFSFKYTFEYTITRTPKSACMHTQRSQTPVLEFEGPQTLV